LIVTLVVVPITSYYFDEPLSEQQWHLLQVAGYIYLGVALSCFVLAEITKNCSQVDKIWSIVPIAYVWWFAFATGWADRPVIMAVMVTLWGIRLTYNFARRGAYTWRFWEGEEDYRWEVLRQKPMFAQPWKWTLFNLFFISLYQNGLILLFCLPILIACGSNTAPLGSWDFLLAGLMLALLVVETIADQQQWNYQNEKHRRIAQGLPLEEPYSKGFVHSGLWRWVRHPNYAAEQAIWVVFYFFSVAATGRWLNWSATGALLLLVLFQGSSDFSEEISTSKYPAYKEYQSKVGRFLPRFW